MNPAVPGMRGAGGFMRKNLITAVVASVCLFCFAGLAAAGAEHRATVNRKANKVKSWQADQNQAFRAVEHEAEHLIRKLEGLERRVKIGPSNSSTRGK